MDRDNLTTLLIDGQTTEQFTVNLVLGLIGLIGSLLVQLIRSWDTIKSTGGFSIIRWLQDNYFRVLLSILIILVGAARFELVTNHFGDWGAMGLGFMTDKVIEGLLKLKKSLKLNARYYGESTS